MSRRRAARHASPVWLALWGAVAASAVSCGNGSDVYVGRLSTHSGTGGGSSGGLGVCGVQPCADHRGTHVFVDASAPPDAADRFGRASEVPSGTDPLNEPTLVYPSDETMFPLNVRNVRHEWRGPADADTDTLFELEFEGKNTTVRVYTTQTSFVPDELLWDYIAESNRGYTVKWTVRCITPAAPTSAVRSAAHSLLYATQSVDGAIYYWSTAGKGVMKGLVSAANPEKFYPAAAGPESETYTGGHSLSRDGKRLAIALVPELRVVSVPERELVFPQTGAGGVGGAGMKGEKAAWSTFSHDGSRLLVAQAGRMTLLDATTGETIGPAEAIAVPAGKFATHPDWSALGDRVAFTLADKGGDNDVEKGSIFVASFADDSFGAPEELVPNSGGSDNNYFPVWSPDSRYLAFVNTNGKSQDSTAAKLKLFDVAAQRVIELSRLNQRVNALDGEMKLGNSMPSFAPSSTPGSFWLSFSSNREYAHENLRDQKREQIWVSAIDPSLVDPSYAAFWAPFQSIDDDNHRAVWTHTREDRECRCVEICGDLLDNDCDGSADEAECSARCAD